MSAQTNQPDTNWHMETPTKNTQNTKTDVSKNLLDIEIETETNDTTSEEEKHHDETLKNIKTKNAWTKKKAKEQEQKEIGEKKNLSNI